MSFGMLVLTTLAELCTALSTNPVVSIELDSYAVDLSMYLTPYELLLTNRYGNRHTTQPGSFSQHLIRQLVSRCMSDITKTKIAHVQSTRSELHTLYPLL